MLDWLFQPTCPCDPAAKTWVEERLRWLAEEFDDSAFSGRRVVLPTAQFFPDKFDSSEPAIRRMLDRICRYMDVDAERVDLKFMEKAGKLWLVNESGQHLPSGAAGTYREEDGRFIITLDVSGLDNLEGLVGTIAHELAHARLLGERRADHDEFDNELLTDLTVVHFGLGIFMANLPRSWTSKMTKWPDSDLRKPEYMSPPMYGWALAHLARFRGESKPAWAKHLSLAARANLKQGIRYLQATGDSSYKL